MSAFLGDIHYWLYNKIQYLQKINDVLIHTYQLNDEEYNTSVDYTLPLEQIIDLDQIHSSLNDLVQDVEHRNALIINKILTQTSIEDVKQTYYQLGKQKASLLNNAIEAYEYIHSYLLDGMPCDQGIDIMIQDNDQVIYEYNPSVHSSLIPFSTLQALRSSWIEGLLTQSHISLTQLSNTQFILKLED